MERSRKKPKYIAVKSEILKWIENETYSAGDLLPTEQNLEKEFGVSRTTVRLAMGELEREGYVIRRPGFGTVVSERKTNFGPRRLLSFSEEMRQNGIICTSKIEDFTLMESESLKVIRLLEMNQNECAWYVERLRICDGSPLVLEKSHIPCSRIPHMGIEDIERPEYSFYNFCKSVYDIEVVYATENIRARQSTLRESRALQTEVGVPVLQVDRLTFGRKKGENSLFPIEYVSMAYDAEKYNIQIQLTSEHSFS